MSSPPAGPTGRQPKAVRWRRLARRDPRAVLTVAVVYRGGEECWYELRARGERGRFPGHVALHDAMREINEGCGR